MGVPRPNRLRPEELDPEAAALFLEDLGDWPKSRDVPLDTLLAENEQLLASCRPPAPGTLRANTFEGDILSLYAYPAFNIGGTCERAGLKAEARTWYQRALAINPQFPKAREALARLEH